jgi:hypothetical protein
VVPGGGALPLLLPEKGAEKVLGWRKSPTQLHLSRAEAEAMVKDCESYPHNGVTS